MDLLAFFSKSSSSSLHVDYFNKGHAIIATSVLAEVGRERQGGGRKGLECFWIAVERSLGDREPARGMKQDGSVGQSMTEFYYFILECGEGS